MKTPHKFYLGLIVCLIAMLIIGYIWSIEKDKKIQSLNQANGILQNDITAYKHVNGKLVADNQAAEIRGKELRESLPLLADALTKQMDIKLKNLRAGVVAEIRAAGYGNSVITKIPYNTTGSSLVITDSMTNHFEPFALTFDDGYLNFKSDVYSEYQAPSEYTYSDTIKFAFNMQGKFLQRKQLFVSGSLSNPTAKVVKSQGVLVNEFKQKRFGIGPSVSWGLGADLRPQTTIGVSLHWSWIRF